MASPAATPPSKEYLDETLQPATYAVMITFFIIAMLSVFLRYWSRAQIVRIVGWDDWSMLLVGLACAGQHVILFLFLSWGGGRHIEYVAMTDPKHLLELPKLLFVQEIYYMFNLWVIKISILLFYLRLSPERNFRYLVFGGIGLNTAATVICWLIYCFQCRPLKAMWDPTITEKDCLPQLFLFFFPASLNIFVDIVILVLPIKILWRLQVSTRKKIGTMAILGVGSISVIVSCIRLIILYLFAVDPDFTWILGWMLIASSVEIDIGILAANIPSMKAIWVRYVRGVTPQQTPVPFNYELSGSNQSRGTKNSKKYKHHGDSVLDGTMIEGHHSQEELYDRNQAQSYVAGGESLAEERSSDVEAGASYKM